MISSDISVLSSRECKAKPKLNRGKNTLIFAKGKVLFVCTYVNWVWVIDILELKDIIYVNSPIKKQDE